MSLFSVRAAVVAVFLSAGVAAAAPPPAPFESIDGGQIRLADYAGHPVLVVNTASFCGYAYQFEGLQKLYDTYRAKGLVVLAVPSDDFNQEAGSDKEVKEYCQLTYGIDLPMTGITHVKGPEAHPFFAWVKAGTGFEPGWNFNKILLDPKGEVVATWGAGTKPMSAAITGKIEALLNYALHRPRPRA
jgi:glutathione peroxidase